MKSIFIVILMLATWTCSLHAQTYSPVAITGYNNDIIAETGTDATAVTSTGVDLQQKILYSLGFAATNSIAGGLADNGTIVSGQRTYQLGDYALNNALYLSANAFAANTLASGSIAMVTPATFTKISVLAFSTEQSSVLDISLKFTDGTVISGGTVNVADWFNGPGSVISSVGRIQRIPSPPYVVEDLAASNPRFYPIDINIPCAVQSKMLDSIFFNYVSGGGNDSRAVILALSGVSYTPMTITSSLVVADCGKSNGSATVSAEGGSPLITYEWNTVPVQLTKTATDIPAGTYTCTITDGNACTTMVPMTVTEKSVVKMKATARPGSICSGSATTLSAIPSGGIIMHYTWQPSNITDSTTSISPTDTTMYVVTGEDFFGCLTSDSIKVSVIPRPAAPVASPTSICPDSLATLSVLTPDSSLGYNWYPYPSGGDILGTGDTFVTPPVSETTTWYVEAVTGPCSSDRVPVTVTPFDRPVTPVVVNTAVTTNSATFSWKGIPGATGYLISIDGGAYITVTDTFYNVTGLQQETVNIRVISLGTLSCQTSLPGQATAKLKPGEVFIPNAFTPNGDGKNDIFKPEGNIKTLDMKIFNQWGELISTGSGWNGTSGGKAQPMGVYMYAMKIIMTNGTEVIKKGSVNLLR
ncbi:gliding motility-associated C-terminal domain-containing protein [Chitinophaga sp. YR573]|uniref:gliding motility-associated C-terminal domain-containing protein n=1 Tax=Chitinophaga sp. YR573 TaxID=1881040 RepID=UPI0008BB6183|nr:gliding motility-associated C-terminal domain-containing protein [Chitinophaga sp. YR573]SEW34430.1 gliding motility-associated C-terminal domain-containing protein [Chitinophaga sp. YR573]